MFNSNERRSLFFSALIAGAIHMLAASVAFGIAVYGLHKSSEIAEVYLVGSELDVSLQTSEIQRKVNTLTATPVRYSTAPSPEKAKPETEEIPDDKNRSIVPARIVQTENNRSISYTATALTHRPTSVDAITLNPGAGLNYLRDEKPVYPYLARRMNKEGRVLLRLIIDEKGKVVKAEVVEGAGYGFNEAALEAAKKSTYPPAIKNGVPVTSLRLKPYRFKLTDQQGDGF